MKQFEFLFRHKGTSHFVQLKTVCPLHEGRLHLCLVAITTGMCPVWSRLMSALGIDYVAFFSYFHTLIECWMAFLSLPHQYSSLSMLAQVICKCKFEGNYQCHVQTASHLRYPT